MYEPADKEAPERSPWHWITGTIVLSAGSYAVLAAVSWLVML